MTAILIVNNADLAYALRHHRTHPLATAIRDLLNNSGASVHPLTPTPEGREMDRHFRIQVQKSLRVSLVLALRGLPGVERAYIKLAAEPAQKNQSRSP